ncbi:MAG: hypothetical protein ACKV2O_13485 [Acidimicrobiales bacterium]
MADHYRCVGFPAPDALTLVQLLRRTVTDGVRVSRSDGSVSVRHHDDRSGARITVVLSADGVIRSAKPSFLPTVSRPVRARVHGRHPDSANPDAELVKITLRGAQLPWSVEFEDGAAAVAGLSFGEETDLEVVGFADRLACYEDEGAFAASGATLGAREMLPAGVHGLGRDLGGQRLSALASGVVMEMEELHNGLSGASFLHLVIDTTPGPLDVVVSPQQVDGPRPRRGHLVTGSLWLVARQVPPALLAPRHIDVPASTSVLPVRQLQRKPQPQPARSGPELDEDQPLRPRAPGRRESPRLFSRWC